MSLPLSIAGNVLIWLAIALMIAAFVAAMMSLLKRSDVWMRRSHLAVWAGAVSLMGALLILAFAFVGDAFGIGYVARHSSIGQPAMLKLSAIWAGQSGSLLLWSTLQMLATAIAISAQNKQARAMLPWVTVIMVILSAFFTIITVSLSNPFALDDLVISHGLNPLLRHAGMVFHPPAMYVGYVALSVPFAFALAALLTDNLDHWTTIIRPWVLTAWIGLSLGLLLGMRWAYDVLGWGGYWGWDPVENAGLMPWLTATGLLHSIMMQRERHGFHVWTYVLATLSYVLVLFGTFVTRSGLIQSVHAYVQSPIGGYLLTGLLVALFSSIVLAGVYYRRFKRDAPDDTPLLSRPGLFSLTLVVLCMLAISVFVGTTLPTISQALGNRQFEATPAWYDRVTGPQFALLVLLLGVCPLVGATLNGVLRLPLRRYGGYLVHLGIILMAVGVIGTRMFSQEQSMVLAIGERKSIGPYTISPVEIGDCSDLDRACTDVAVTIDRAGRRIAMVSPRIEQYPGYQSYAWPALASRVGGDVYVVLGGIGDQGELVSLHTIINPLVGFLWAGGMVLMLGAAWALFPGKATRTVQVGYAIVIGVLLILTGWIMWGIPGGILG